MVASCEWAFVSFFFTLCTRKMSCTQSIWKGILCTIRLVFGSVDNKKSLLYLCVYAFLMLPNPLWFLDTQWGTSLNLSQTPAVLPPPHAPTTSSSSSSSTAFAFCRFPFLVVSVLKEAWKEEETFLILVQFNLSFCCCCSQFLLWHCYFIFFFNFGQTEWR